MRWKNSTKYKILEALKNNKLSPQQLSDKLNISVDTLYYNLKSLKSAGLIELKVYDNSLKLYSLVKEADIKPKVSISEFKELKRINKKLNKHNTVNDEYIDDLENRIYKLNNIIYNLKKDIYKLDLKLWLINNDKT